jgi:hypothetical protein
MDGPTIELTLARAPVPAPSFGRFSFGLAGPKAFASKILRRMVVESGSALFSASNCTQGKTSASASASAPPLSRGGRVEI